MVKDDSDRLSAIRQELRRRLGSDRYELWLGPRTELALDGATLRVCCPSPTEAVWLRRRLHKALEECGRSVLGEALSIVYESSGAPCPSPGVESVDREIEREETDPVATPSVAASPGRSPRWTFDSFVVGACNRLAAQAARDVSQQLGRFSPLLLYGPAGVGKSHLLNAVGQHARRGRQPIRWLQLTAEQFTSQFLEALERRALPGFRHKTRNLDMLLVDDVQFLSGKKATLEEMLYTIDALNQRGGQVVMTSDRAMTELAAVSSEIASRISAGLAVALDPPDCATRAGIVRTMAVRMEVGLDDAVVELIARQVVGSGRMLSGAINRLVAASMAAQRPITAELAAPVLEDFCRQHSPQVRLVDIQRAVCEVFGVESASLKSQRKTRSVAEPRMLAMWLARRYTRAALSEIGDFFGRRSHSTVVSAQRKFDGLISRRGEIMVGDQACQVEEAVRRIEARLRTG